MKILVTGATGFIGTHLVRNLVDKGRSVRCLARRNSSINMLESLDVEIFYGDLLDKLSLEQATRGIDIIYNLAGEVFSASKRRYYEVNLGGLSNLLDASLKSSVRKIIHFSSNACVGPNPDSRSPVNENTPCRPIVPYGRSKLEGEYAIKSFSEKFGLPIVIIRPTVVYGPGVSRSSRVFMFLNLIHRGLFRIIGDGKNLISLCCIDNLMHGVSCAENETKAEGQTYFISDEKPHSIREIAEVLAQEEGKTLSGYHLPVWAAYLLSLGSTIPSKLLGVNLPLTLSSIKEINNNWFVDIKKAKEELGYKPEISFEEGIKSTVNWFQNECLAKAQ